MCSPWISSRQDDPSSFIATCCFYRCTDTQQTMKFSIHSDAVCKWLRIFQLFPSYLFKCIRWDVPLAGWMVLYVFIFFTCCCSLVLAEDQCAGCSSALDQDDHVRRLRIEATKRLILDRLQMDDRPSKIDADSRIAFPSTLNPVTADDDEEEDGRDVSDIRQLILFPTKIWPPKRSSRSNNSLLKFHITPEMRFMSLHSAVLWTADTSQEDAPVNSTEVRWHSQQITSSVDRQIDQRTKDRYISLPLDTRVHKMSHLYQFRPYMVVQIDPYRKRRPGESWNTTTKSRRKRSTPTCNSNVTQCCRDSLYVSFKDIGWDDWILAPDGFNAYYCRGSCRTSSAVTNTASPHTAVLQKLLARDRLPSRTRSQLSSCCAPTRFSSLTILYTENNGDVVKHRDLPNMVVESCGCAL